MAVSYSGDHPLAVPAEDTGPVRRTAALALHYVIGPGRDDLKDQCLGSFATVLQVFVIGLALPISARFRAADRPSCRP